MLRIQRRTLLVGSAGLLLTGCQLPGGARLSKIDESPLPKLSPVRSWGEDATPMNKLSEANLVGDVLLLHGNGGTPFVGNLIAVSTKTGRTRWDAKSVEAQLARRPGRPTLLSAETKTTSHDSDALVINQTYLTPCPSGQSVCKTRDTKATAGKGIAAVSVRDGAVRWTAELVPLVPNDHPDARRLDKESVKILGADPRYVLINSGADNAVLLDSPPESGEQMRAVMLDAVTGKELWTVPGVLAFGLAGDVVLAHIPLGSPGERRSGKTLLALDAATGKELWSTRDSDPATGRWVGGADGIAIMVYIDSEDDYGSSILVDSRTGETIAENVLTGQLVSGRDSSDRQLAVWPSSDRHRLCSYQAGGEARISAGEIEEDIDWIRAVVGGYVWVVERTSSSQRSRAFDRSGNACSDWIDGEVQAADDRYLVLSKGDSGFDVCTVR